MGIQGLLPLLKPIQKHSHLKEFAGQAVGVDAYVWLHRATFGCAYDLCMGIPTTKYVKYCMNRVKLLQNNGIWPIIVFDGDHLPMKKGTESQRKKNREAKLELGKEYVRKGDKAKATECFQSCVDVTTRMAYEWIKELKKEQIESIVAPYEADAQLAYLYFNGDISAVITEDSDLLTYGVKNVLYKLNPDGSCIHISLDHLGLIPEMRYWTMDRFREMCILSGCDYVDSPPGIGLKTALKLLNKTDAYALIKSWLNWGSIAKAPKLTEGYLERFTLADITFKHQRVFDRTRGKLVPLQPFPKDFNLTEEVSNSIGPDVDSKVASGVAEGILCPFTKEPFEPVILTPPPTQASKPQQNARFLKVKQATLPVRPNQNAVNPKLARLSLPSIHRPLTGIKEDRRPLQVISKLQVFQKETKPEKVAPEGLSLDGDVDKNNDQHVLGKDSTPTYLQSLLSTSQNQITTQVKSESMQSRKEIKFLDSRLMHHRKRFKSDQFVSPYFKAAHQTKPEESTS